MKRGRIGLLALGVLAVGLIAAYIATRPLYQVWCCDEDGCAPVELFTDCKADQQILYCEWGQSSPQSNPDGSSGWVCLE